MKRANDLLNGRRKKEEETEGEKIVAAANSMTIIIIIIIIAIIMANDSNYAHIEYTLHTVQYCANVQYRVLSFFIVFRQLYSRNECYEYESIHRGERIQCLNTHRPVSICACVCVCACVYICL